jgi:hypothetical protein
MPGRTAVIVDLHVTKQSMCQTRRRPVRVFTRLCTRLPGIAPREFAVSGSENQASGEKSGDCSTLVRRTINRRISIQELSEKPKFDAIIGPPKDSSFFLRHCLYLNFIRGRRWHKA